ncbi:hypothetical protein [Streptomyces sp. NPDC051993]|uniref:hypothetical protein n=1 Tax=Streptomyces sp. NPDC051993 TaxID=3155286 RepID=UPI0034199B40
MPEPDPFDVLDAWFNDTPLHPETIRAYTAALGRRGREYEPEEPRAWFDFLPGRIWRATPNDVETWLASFRTTDGRAGGGLRSRESRLSALTGFYTYAQARRICPGNPADHLQRLDPSRLLTTQYLDSRQMLALLRATDRWTSAHTHRDRALMMLLMSNWRPGQATAWRLEDYHPHDQNGPTAGQPQKGGGKQKNTPLIPLHPETAEAIEAYLPHRRHQPHPTPALSTTPTTGTVLTSRSGRPLDARTTPRTLVQAIATTAPALHGLDWITADTVAHSPSPFDHGQDTTP